MKANKITLAIIICCTTLGGVYAQEKHIIARIDSVNTIPFVYITTNPAVAEPLFLANVALADSIGYILGAAKSNAQLGIIYNYLGKQDLRTEYILKAIKNYKQIDSTRLAGYQYAELGYGIKHRDLNLAESYMMKGLTILKAFPGTITQADAFNNYGIIKLMKQEYDSALNYVNRSLEIKVKAEDHLGVSYSLGNLSEIYLGMGKYNEAIKRLNNSYTIRKELKDSTAMGFDLLNLGMAYNKKADYPMAIIYFKEALNIALLTDYTNLAERNFKHISENFEQLAQFDSALYYHKKYTIYKDSLLNLATNNRVSELQVQFETEEKEKQIAQSKAALTNILLKVRNRNWVVSVLALLFSSGALVTYLLLRHQRIKRESEQRESELELQLAKAEAENRMRIEKERISRDLHDNVGAQISSLIAGIEISGLHIKKDDVEKAANFLQNLDEDARNTMIDLRETIWLLENEEVAIKDFVEHIKQYINRQKKYLNGLELKVLMKITSNIILNPTESLNLMRIIQEALNNTRKYAEASIFKVEIYTDDKQFKMVISDNGKGLNVEMCKGKGNGISNIHHRAKEINAECEMISKKGIGTTYEIRM